MYEWMWRLPWSGNVAQDILPGLMSSNTNITIAGDARLEGHIVREVASYGSQLGVLIDAVSALAESIPTTPESEERLAELQRLAEKIRKAKERDRETLRQEAREAMERLQKVDAGAAASLASCYASTRKNQ